MIAGEWLVLERLEGGSKTTLLVGAGGWLEPFARRVPGRAGRLLATLAALIERWSLESPHDHSEVGMLGGIGMRVESGHLGTIREAWCAT